jgi:hypothetical protein
VVVVKRNHRREQSRRAHPTAITVQPCAVCGRPVIEGVVFECVECGDLVPVHLGECERQLRVQMFPFGA